MQVDYYFNYLFMKNFLKLYFGLVIFSFVFVPSLSFAQFATVTTTATAQSQSISQLIAMIADLQRQLDSMRQIDTTSAGAYPIIITAPVDSKQLKVGDPILIKWKVGKDLSNKDIPKKIFMMVSDGTSVTGNINLDFSEIFDKSITTSRKSYRTPGWGWPSNTPGKYTMKFVSEDKTPNDWRDNEVVSQSVTFFIK